MPVYEDDLELHPDYQDSIVGHEEDRHNANSTIESRNLARLGKYCIVSTKNLNFKSDHALECSSEASVKSDDFSSSDEEDYSSSFPITHAFKIPSASGSSKACSALALDTDGHRIFRGGYDYTVSMFQFSRLHPDKIEPEWLLDPTEYREDNVGHYPIRSIDISPKLETDNDLVLVTNGSTQPFLFNAYNGDSTAEFAKGDPYIMDLRRTKGHVAEANCAVWLNTANNKFVSSGSDSTIRIWDINSPSSQVSVLVHRSQDPLSQSSTKREQITVVSCQSQSDQIAYGASDGSISIFNERQSRPAISITNAHKTNISSGVRISAIQFSPVDTHLFVSKSTDGVVNLFDLRKPSKPVKCLQEETHGLAQFAEVKNMAYSPTGSHLIMGSNSSLQFVDAKSLDIVHSFQLSTEEQILQTVWHPKINQIFCSTNLGAIYCLFSTASSLKGIIDSLSRAPRSHFIDNLDDVTSNVKPVVYDFNSRTSQTQIKKKFIAKMEDRNGNKRLKRNEKLSQPTSTSKPNVSATIMHEDPREALLAYATEAEREPIFTKIYKKTQPNTLFHNDSKQTNDE